MDWIDDLEAEIAARPDLRERHPPLAPCGTSGGYHRHRANGEPACDPCKAAHAAVERVGAARRPPRRTRAYKPRRAAA